MITDRPLEYKDGKLTINPEFLMVKEFALLWKRDKSKDKEFGFKIMSALFFIADYRSPSYAVPLTQRIKDTAEGVMDDENWRPDAAFRAAIKKYQQMQFTPSMILLQSANHGVRQLTDYIKDQKYKNGRGKVPSFEIDDVLKPLGKIPKLIKDLTDIENKVKMEQEDESKIMGGGSQGMFEDGENMEIF